MTFTFKLARRLAASHIVPFVGLAMLAACGDGGAGQMGPQDPPTGGTSAEVPAGSPVQTLVITPKQASLTARQTLKLAAFGRSAAGDSVGVDVEWTSSGGAIGPDGAFTADAAGSYKVIGRDRAQPSLADSTTIVVAPVAPPAPPAGDVRFAHQPAGMSRVLEDGFSSLGSGEAGVWSAPRGGNISIKQDASAPLGGGVLDTRFPSGMQSGVSPVTWRAWQGTLQPGSAPEYRKLYVSMRMKIPGADFQNQQVGTKLWYAGYGNTSNDNDAFLMMHGNGATSNMSAMKLVMYVSGTDDADGASQPMAQNVDTRALLTAGSWHHVEVYMEQGSVDHANGVLRIWVDGVKVTDYTAVKYLDSRHSFTHGFQMWQWTPVWGGVGGTRTREDHILLDHVYISGMR